MADSPTLHERGDGLTEDPLVSFQFGLLIEGKLAGFFTECSGIGSEHDVVERQLVNDKGHSFVKKVPGILKYNDITLKRGITSDMQMWEWRAEAEKGNMEKARTNCSIVMYDRQFAEVAKWHFYNAWPSKISGPDLSSDGSEFGVEDVTIVHEGFYREV